MNEISNTRMFFLTLGSLIVLAYDKIRTLFIKTVDPKDMTAEQRKSYLINSSLIKGKDLE